MVLGPTGSGKTALSLFLAERLKGEIVSCDSVAIYRDFEIGTAKPSHEDRARAPHHLLDAVDPRQPVTAGEYARQARAVLSEIKSRNAVPIVVGGTGLYLRALLQGLFSGPERSDELRSRLRNRAAERGSQHLHAMLQRLDPSAAHAIHPHDLSKLVRALEVCLSSRARMTDLWKQGRDPLHGFRILRIGLDPDRALLYQRLNQRAHHMFNSGLIEETRRLLAEYGPEVWPLSSLGYKQAVQHLRQETDLATAIQSTQQAHRNYAKRQMTWFRREPDVRWFAGFGDDQEIRRQALLAVEELGGSLRTEI